MDEEPSRVELDETHLERLLAWGRLCRGVGVASDAKKLILAVLGLVLFDLGRNGLDHLFGTTGLRSVAPDPSWLASAGKPGYPPIWASLQAEVLSAPWRLTEPIRFLAGPFVAIFALGNDWRTLAHALVAAAWGTAVWGLFGGAIARIAVVQVARTERIGIVQAVRFAARRWLSLSGTPFCPMIGIAFFTVLCALFGLLYRLPGPVGQTLAGILAVFPLVAGLVMTIILISLAAGWPLMLATVASEAEDGFDALSRSFAYVNQRPGRYAAATALAWGLGILGLMIVELFARTTIHMAHWAISFGAPGELLDTLLAGGTASGAAQAHTFWLSAVALVAHGWIYSYFWTSAVIVYLLLRQDVDGTPWHAIALPERPAFEFEPEPSPQAAGGAGPHAAAESAAPAGPSASSLAPDASTIS
jgi:hypothetical protein